jgi:hypothetical protein
LLPILSSGICHVVGLYKKRHGLVDVVWNNPVVVKTLLASKVQFFINAIFFLNNIFEKKTTTLTVKMLLFNDSKLFLAVNHYDINLYIYCFSFYFQK